MNGKSIELPTLVLVAIVLSMLAQPVYSSLQVNPRSVVYVKVANGSAAIPGASVFLDGVLMGQTDSQGSVFIQGRLKSLQEVTVTKNGYDPYETAISVGPANALTAYLTPGGGRLHTEGRWIKDANGNVVRLVGAARHWSTFYWKNPLEAINEGVNLENLSTYDLFASTGANTVRLCLNKWSWYNASSTYRPAIDTIIQRWAQRHVYVVLDFHMIYDIDADQAWTWEKKVDVIVELNGWKQFMTDLAQRYATYPNVIGFDLLNEPPSYTIWQNKGYDATQADLIWRNNVSEVIKAIHAVDPSYLCFVEALGSENLGKFIENPLPFPNNIVYAFHRYYGWDYGTWGGYDYAKSYANGDFNTGFVQMEALYEQVAFKLLDMGYPVVLTETGTKNDSFTPNTLRQMDDLYRLLEKYQVGVWQWSYDRGYPNGSDGYVYLLKDDVSGLTEVGQAWAKHMRP